MARLTLRKLISLMKLGFHVEAKVLLMAGLFSRHKLSLIGNIVRDCSYVDGSTTRYTLREFKQQSIVAKAARMNNLIFERKRGEYGNLQEVQTRKGSINRYAENESA